MSGNLSPRSAFADFMNDGIPSADSNFEIEFPKRTVLDVISEGSPEL